MTIAEQAGPRGRGLRDRLLNVGHFIDHMFMLVYTTAVITIAAQGLASYGELIALATTGFVLFGVLSLPFGWLGDRYGRRPLMVVFFIGIGASAILTGLAQTPWQIGAGLALIGLFAAIYHPIGIPMLVQGLDRPGRAIGLNGVFGNLGVAAAPIITGVLIAAFGWRMAFIGPGIVAVLLGVAFWRLVPEDGPCERQARNVPLRALFEILGWRRILGLLAVVSTFGGIIFSAMTVALPKLFEEQPVTGMDGILGYAAQASLVYACASVAQIITGTVVDRYSARKLLAGLLLLQAISFGLLTVATGPVVFPLALAGMLAVFGQIPIVDTIVTRTVPDALRGRVFSIKYLLNLGVGALAVPMIAVLHGTGSGFAAVFTVLAALAACLVAVALMLPGRGQVPLASQAAE